MLVFSHSENNSRQDEVTEQGEGRKAKYSCVVLRYWGLKVCASDMARMS